MEHETEAMMAELYRLFGRLRYALMETQAAMAQIVGRAQGVDKQGKPDEEEHESDGWTGIPYRWRGQEEQRQSRDSECPVDDSIKGTFPRRIP